MLSFRYDVPSPANGMRRGTTLARQATMLPRKRYLVLIAVGVLVVLVGTFLFQSTTLYSSQVIVAERGAALGINPLVDRIDFGDIPVGQEVTKTLILENAGAVDNYIAIFVMGGIGDLVKVEPNFSTLKGGEGMDVQFRLNMPDSAPVQKKFSGRVFVFRLPKGLF